MEESLDHFRDPLASSGFRGGEKSLPFTSLRLPLLPPVQGFCKGTPATQLQRVATSPPTGWALIWMRFLFIKNKGWSPSLAARGQESTRRVSREKTHRENDPRERERGKHQSSGRWAFSTFPLKRKKVFQAVGSKNRQEGAEAGGFAEQAAGRLWVTSGL